MEVVSDKILIIIVLILLLATVLMFLIIVISKVHYALKDQRKQQIARELNSLITSYLDKSEVDKDHLIKSFQLLVQSNRSKAILIDQLMVLNNNFSGEYANLVKEIYHRLKLFEFSIVKMNSNLWYRKIKGMNELSAFEYEPAFDGISTLIYHPIGEVRRNARVSLVRLKKKEALFTLKDLRGSMTQWTTLNIISVLKREPIKLTKEEMNLLYAAKNDYIRLLATEIDKSAHVQ